MVVHTLNSVYTFIDLGDGCFDITSTNPDPRYGNPGRCTVELPPEIGQVVNIYRLALKGTDQEPWFHTSRVVRIES